MFNDSPLVRGGVTNRGEDRLALAGQCRIAPGRGKRRRGADRKNDLCYNQHVLDKLTIDDFKPHVGSSFRVSDPPAELTLERVAAVMASESARLKRQPFSLYFLGPADPTLTQRIYDVRHDAFPESLGIFLVPIGRTSAGIQYEAVFT